MVTKITLNSVVYVFLKVLLSISNAVASGLLTLSSVFAHRHVVVDAGRDQIRTVGVSDCQYRVTAGLIMVGILGSVVAYLLLVGYACAASNASSRTKSRFLVASTLLSSLCAMTALAVTIGFIVIWTSQKITYGDSHFVQVDSMNVRDGQASIRYEPQEQLAGDVAATKVVVTASSGINHPLFVVESFDVTLFSGVVLQSGRYMAAVAFTLLCGLLWICDAVITYKYRKHHLDSELTKREEIYVESSAL